MDAIESAVNAAVALGSNLYRGSASFSARALNASAVMVNFALLAS